MPDDMDRLREHINRLDNQLVKLLNERAETALKIGKVKATTGTEVYDPNRERLVLDRIDTLNSGPLDKGALEEVFASIIAACRQIQMR